MMNFTPAVFLVSAALLQMGGRASAAPDGPLPPLPPVEGVKATKDQAKSEPAQPLTLASRPFAEYEVELNKVLHAFTSAKTVDEMLPFVRNRKTVEPLIRACYTAAKPWKPLNMRRDLVDGDPHSVNGNFFSTSVETPDFSLVQMSLEWTGQTFVVDWESLVEYGEMTWEDLVKKRPVTPVLMRVILEHSISTDYFNEDFTDSAKYHCYQIHDHAAEHFLSGYAAVGSPVDKLIRQNLWPVNGGIGPDRDKVVHRTYAIVRVQFAKEGKSTRQVEITELVETGWVTGAKEKPSPRTP
jgi:hypothetical protein